VTSCKLNVLFTRNFAVRELIMYVSSWILPIHTADVIAIDVQGAFYISPHRLEKLRLSCDDKTIPLQVAGSQRPRSGFNSHSTSRVIVRRTTTF
jgi:hypothetical protein